MVLLPIADQQQNLQSLQLLKNQIIGSNYKL